MKTVPVRVDPQSALAILDTPAMTLVPDIDTSLNMYQFQVWIGGERTPHVLHLSLSGNWSMTSELQV